MRKPVRCASANPTCRGIGNRAPCFALARAASTDTGNKWRGTTNIPSGLWTEAGRVPRPPARRRRDGCDQPCLASIRARCSGRCMQPRWKRGHELGTVNSAGR
jgi:hypothetical protein